MATSSALTAVGNKIPNVTSLVKKTDYNTKISEIENKVNNNNHTLASDVFKARLAAQTYLIRKPDFDSKIEGISDNTKYLLIENELKKLQKFDSDYFRSKSHFEEDSTQSYLSFQPMYRYFKRIAGVVGSGNYI